MISGTNFLDEVQVNQGEFRLTGSSSLFFSDVTLADVPGVTVTLAQSSSSTSIGGLSGGGTSGGVVRPDDQARTVTLTDFGGGTFGGTLEDNGSGVLVAATFLRPPANPDVDECKHVFRSDGSHQRHAGLRPAMGPR